MISYKEDYGADADGNRGVPMIFTDLEPSDTPEIVEQIKEAIIDGAIDEYSDSLQITLIEPITEEDVHFQIEVSEYITKNEFDKLVKESSDA